MPALNRRPARDLREALPFSHREHDIYLVTRLDAFTADDASSLVDRAHAPTRDGRIVLDQRDEDGTKPGNQWMVQASRRLLEQGHGERVANVIALNNLAYGLAVHRKAPAEALPLAKRAASLAPLSASVLDTLGWVEHLLGNHSVAAKILADAIKLDPAAPETRLHASAVAEALGDRTNAEREVKEALRLNPSLEQRDDTRQLRERISRLPLRKS